MPTDEGMVPDDETLDHDGRDDLQREADALLDHREMVTERLMQDYERKCSRGEQQNKP